MDRLPFQEELIMHRFYADPARSAGDLVYLAEDDARHALSVLRLKAGQAVEVFLSGQRYEAEISSADRNDACVKLLSQLPSAEAAACPARAHVFQPRLVGLRGDAPQLRRLCLDLGVPQGAGRLPRDVPARDDSGDA